MEEPWLSARNGIDEEAASNNPIDDNLIDDYFEKINKKYKTVLIVLFIFC